MKRTTLAALLGATLLVAGCGATDDPDDSGTDTSPAAAEDTTQAANLGVTDPWVKAADSGMTAGFANLTNSGEEDIVVTGAESSAAAMVELHEVVENDDGSTAMRPKVDGFTVPAGGELVLEPGGYHLMLMELPEPLHPGATVTFTLTMADGSTTEIESTVKRFDGADEKYQEGPGGDDASSSDGASSDQDQ